MRTLFKNGHIVSLDETNTIYSFLGIEKDHICYLGNEEPKEKYNKIIDLKGQYIYPALTDSHLHLLYTLAITSVGFDICEIKKDGISPNNLEGIKNKLISFVKENPSKKLIVANQYITSGIKENRLPTRHELDNWCPNKEIAILNIDGHSGSFSSLFLKKINLYKEDQNGILSNKDYDLVSDKITDYLASKVNLFSLAKGLNNFTNDCIKYGIGRVCALEGNDNGRKDLQLSLITFLARRMKIKVRLYAQYHNLESLKNLTKKLLHLRLGGCNKWELDGAIGSHSASFYKPYTDNGISSNTYYEDKYVNMKLNEFVENKFQFTCHAIGTKAIDQIVNAYKQSKFKENKFTYRIDHFEFPSKEAVEFVTKEKIALAIQPGYSYIDKRFLRSYERYLPKEIIDNQIPLKDIVSGGGMILGSSDSPVQNINPYLQMQGMIDFYVLNQSISPLEALRSYTSNASHALNELDTGCLKINNKADFFISSNDLINLKSNFFGEVKNSALYIDGKMIKKQKSIFKTLLSLLFTKPKKI